MSRRSRRNHSAAFKAKVAIAAIPSPRREQCHRLVVYRVSHVVEYLGRRR